MLPDGRHFRDRGGMALLEAGRAGQIRGLLYLRSLMAAATPGLTAAQISALDAAVTAQLKTINYGMFGGLPVVVGAHDVGAS
jgi:hypothetical protein